MFGVDTGDQILRATIRIKLAPRNPGCYMIFTTPLTGEHWGENNAEEEELSASSTAEVLV